MKGSGGSGEKGKLSSMGPEFMWLTVSWGEDKSLGQED